MSVNRHKPHVWILPEDDANRQLANGFLLHPELSVLSIRVLEEVGGWKAVLTRFLRDHAAGMDKYPDRLMILLIDFDDDEERLEYVRTQIPEHLGDRVFVLGTLSDPEALKKAIPGSSYESIGMDVATDCYGGTNQTWGHPLLHHNAAELDRLRANVVPILFPGTQKA